MKSGSSIRAERANIPNEEISIRMPTKTSRMASMVTPRGRLLCCGMG
jgi:hypothetical protein